MEDETSKHQEKYTSFHKDCHEIAFEMMTVESAGGRTGGRGKGVAEEA
jgi:hypothetical protein